MRQPLEVQRAAVQLYMREPAQAWTIALLTCSWWHQCVGSTLVHSREYICRRANTFISHGGRLCDSSVPFPCNAVQGGSDRRHLRHLPSVMQHRQEPFKLWVTSAAK